MKGAISTFWGKLSDDQPREWHPLIHHCADVAACCELLLTRTLLGARLARLGGLGALDEVHVARLSVLAALHDLGKFNRGFQAKGEEKPTSVCGHVREILIIFGDGYREEQDRLLRVLPVAELESWGDDDVACKLLVAAIGHHGRPFPCGSSPGFSFNEKVWSSSRFGDPFDGMAELVAATRRWFPNAFLPGGPRLPHAPAFQHGFAGLVMLADWLGSHRGFFPYSETFADRMPDARARAAVALREVGLDVEAARVALGPTRPGFSAISPHPHPQPAQEKTEELPVDAGGGLTILEAETGSGKTEAALLRFARLFHAGLVDGMYFALPTRTAATQIHGRVVQAVERAFPDGARPPVVLAVPGYLRVDDRDGQRLPGFEVLWNDDRDERYRFRGWAAENSKRYLAGAVVVGTVDQVLLSTIMVSHAHLRATAAARHLLVVDEVHASDAYMNCLLEQVLAFHLRAGGHAFLMSATLGASARTRLLQAVGARVECPALAHATDMPYPMLTHVNAGRGVDVIAVERGDRVRKIRPLLPDIADEPPAIARRALDAACCGARVLVVRNLVRECVATQEALEELARGRGELDLLFRSGGLQAPHHSRFAREDRQLLDRAVEHEFGKARPSGRGCVLVATQTIEQSLDLDADLLLTDLCPMDVLLQRLGRLHRHVRTRPPGFETPTVSVLVPSERDLGRYIRKKDGVAFGPHGYGTVYSDMRVLEATWRACEENQVFEIPADNRRLVEAATHPEALGSLARELGEPWGRHEETLRGRLVTDRQIAGHVLVNRSVAFGDAAFLDKEEAGKIATRLGNDDRTISFSRPQTSPLGSSITNLVLPHHLLRGGPADPLAPVDVEDRGGTLVFSYGDATYLYDRLGLRPGPTQLDNDREGEEGDFSQA